MAYTAFDKTKPVTSPDSRQTGIDAIRNNGLALRDGILIGRLAGWTGTKVTGSGDAESPQYHVWSNGVERLRATYSYTNGFRSQIVWEYSGNSGTTPNNTGTWDVICTETVSYDGSWNFTGGNNSSLLSIIHELFGKFKLHRDSSAVHNLGSIATQDAANVNISGGAIANVTIAGGSASVVIEREAKVAKNNVSGASTLNWAAGGVVTATITGAGAAFSHQNLPSGVVGYLTIDLTNGGIATSGATLFPGVAWPNKTVPSFQVNGRDIVTLMCHDGSTVNGVAVTNMGT